MSFLEMLKLSFSFCEEQSEDEEIRVHVEMHKHSTPFQVRGAQTTRNKRNVPEFLLPVLCPPRGQPDTL